VRIFGDAKNARAEDASMESAIAYWKMRHQFARMENAELENARYDVLWNTVYCLCLLNRAAFTE